MQVRALQSLTDAIEVLVKVHYIAGIPNNAANTMASPSVDNIKPHLLMQRLHRFLPHEQCFGLSPQELRAVRRARVTARNDAQPSEGSGAPREGGSRA